MKRSPTELTSEESRRLPAKRRLLRQLAVIGPGVWLLSIHHLADVFWRQILALGILDQYQLHRIIELTMSATAICAWVSIGVGTAIPLIQLLKRERPLNSLNAWSWRYAIAGAVTLALIPLATWLRSFGLDGMPWTVF